MSEPQPFIQPPESQPGTSPTTPTFVPVPPAATPTPTAPVPAPKKTWWKTILFIVAAVVMIPYYAFQHMEKRLAEEALLVDPQVGVKLHVGSGPVGDVFYVDGTRETCDGYGLATLTWEDFQSQKDRFGDAVTKLAQEDFPVVVFFNSSGFDSTGDPVAVRRAKDGSFLYKSPRLTPLLKNCIPQRDGSFLVFYQNGTKATVTEQDWYEKYMGLPLHPTPAEPPTTPSAGEPPPKPDASVLKPTTGLKGQAFKPTLKGIEPLSGATIVVFSGEIKPADSVKTKPVVNTIVAKDGQYSISLAPGKYTVAVVIDGKIYGNAQDQSSWPTVEVKDSVVSYDIRFTQGLSIP